MTLKRLATIISAAAGTVLVVSGIIFMVIVWRHSEDKPPEDRILNVSVYKEPSESYRGSYIPLTVNGSGEFVVDGKVMPDEELLEKLRTMARVSSDADVRIHGDDETSWEAMIRAVDLIETTGLTNVTFATRKTISE